MSDSDPPDVFSDQTSLSIRRELKTLFCDPCFEDGYTFEAEGFCVDCTQLLCLTCFQHHRTPKPFRNHQVLDKQQMPQTKPDKVYKDECTDKCDRHQNELIKYYCKDHQAFGCSVCMTIGHRTCKVDYIPDLAEDLFNSDEYKTFKDDVDSLIQITTSIKAKTKINIKRAQNRADVSVAEIRKLRKEVNEFFDTLEQNVTTELSKIQEENQNTVKAIDVQNGAVSDEIQRIHQNLLDNVSKKQRCRLFVDTKRLQKKINNLKTDLSQLESRNRIREVVFKPSLSVTTFIRDQAHVLGSLVDLYQTVPVNSPSGISMDCSIIDIAVLSGGRIAVHDSKNKSIKVIDTKKGKVVATMSHKDYGLTTVSDNMIAVIKNCDIELYSVTDQLKLQKTIRNTGLRTTIVYTNNRFIGVSSMLPTLRMVDMNGAVIKTFPTETNGKSLFVDPHYIALSPDHTLICVSNGGDNTVTCLTLEGEVKARYKPGSEWSPTGVAVSRDGDVYVCNYDNNNIHILTSDLKEEGVIPGDKYGIHEPSGLAYCGRERKLYIGMMRGQSIGVLLNI